MSANIILLLQDQIEMLVEINQSWQESNAKIYTNFALLVPSWIRNTVITCLKFNVFDTLGVILKINE